MQTYRSLETKQAVQYLGEPIEGVTCAGSSLDPDEARPARAHNGCDSSRAHLPHVHTAATGGLSVVKPGDWVMPIQGGPFLVVADGLFRSFFEVPAPVLELDVPAPPVNKKK